MLASDPPSETGGERPHKRLSKFDPFRTSRAAGQESLKWCCKALKYLASGEIATVPSEYGSERALRLL